MTGPKRSGAAERCGEQGRRGDRERLACDPRRSAGEVHDGAAEQSDDDVQRERELRAADADPQPRRGADQDRCDQQCGGERGGGEAKVSDWPDSGELEDAERLQQVSDPRRLGLAAREEPGEQTALVRKERADDDPDGHDARGRERDECGNRADARAKRPRPRLVRAGADPAEEHDHQRRSQPAGRTGSERLDQRSDCDRERKQFASSLWTLRQDFADQRDAERQEEGRRQLLDAAPQRVAVEQRGLRADERSQRGDRRGAHERAQDRVEAQGECRSATCQVGLEDPGDVEADERAPDAREHERTERVAGADVAGVEQPECRRRFAADRARMRHRVIDDVEPGGGVVEPDIAGEGRSAREQHRCAVDEQRRRGRRAAASGRSAAAARRARARSRRRRRLPAWRREPSPRRRSACRPARARRRGPAAAGARC